MYLITYIRVVIQELKYFKTSGLLNTIIHNTIYKLYYAANCFELVS